MKTRIVIVGCGKGGRALLELFKQDPTVHVLGVADINPDAPGLQMARSLGIPVTTGYRELLEIPGINLIIDVTGDPEAGKGIKQLKPDQAEVMGGAAARFLWALLEERKRKAELDERYELALRELTFQTDRDFVIGENQKMKNIADLIRKVAPTPTTVLIRGETGTGKEVVARAIHRYSHLKDKPLLTVNCTALSVALAESELFGHKRGSFTGAVEDKMGLFDKADGGTIFLDEIGDMSPEIQSKMLRVLEAGEVRRVGDVTTKKVKVRIIAATNRDLEEAIERGDFREDLFYRFNSFSIALLPLRERREDIRLLSYHFLHKAVAKVNKRVDQISAQAMECLVNYSWPGNLRELENIIERAVILTPHLQIEMDHLPLHVNPLAQLRTDSPSPNSFQSKAQGFLTEGFMQAKERMIQKFEQGALSRYLSEAQGNVAKAARLANLPRRTFHRLLAKHGIRPR
jgi:transcriptional regulator with GAF, ATPase, and Fis domain